MAALPESEPLAGVLGKRIESLSGIYQKAQEDIQKRLTQAALTDFQKFRYGEVLKQVNMTVQALDGAAADVASMVVTDAYKYGADLSVAAYNRWQSTIDPYWEPANINLGNKLHTTAIQAVSDQMTLDLLAANQSIGQNAQRILRATQQTLLEERQVNQLIAKGLVEGGTRKEVSRALEAKLREQLANGQFVTINGRNYRPDYYADLVVRTRTREAVTHGSIGAMVEKGVDLVQISVHEKPCLEICQALQGKVFSISGKDPDFPRLEQRPPFHPNCEHVVLPFIREAYDDTDIEALKKFSTSKMAVTGNDEYQKLITSAQKEGLAVAKAIKSNIDTIVTPSVASEFMSHAQYLKMVEDSIKVAKMPQSVSQKLMDQVGDLKFALQNKANLHTVGDLMKVAKEAKIKNWDYAVKKQLVELLTSTDDAAKAEIHTALAAKKQAMLAAQKAKTVAKTAAAAAQKAAAAEAEASAILTSAMDALGSSVDEITQKILSAADNYKLSDLGKNLAAWKQNTLNMLNSYTSQVGTFPHLTQKMAMLSEKIVKNLDDIYKFVDNAPHSEIVAGLKKAGFKYWNQVSKEEGAILLKTNNKEVWDEVEANIKEKISAKIKQGIAAKKAAKAAEEAAQKAAAAAAQKAAEEAAQQAATGLAPVVDVRSWEAVDKAWDTAKPKFTALPGRADVGGVHRKYFYVDEAGDKWLFKPYSEPFRAEADEMAYRVQRLLDPDCVEVRKIELDGRIGSIQKMRTDLLDQFDYNQLNVVDISATDLEQIEREHVLDWLLSQHDGHSEQFIRGTNGHVYGIDKGQCFKFFPSDELSIDYNPNATYLHKRTLYNDIGAAVRSGQMTVDPNWALRTIEKVEAISDDEYIQILTPYAKSRFGRDKTRYNRFLRDALERKHNLRKDFEAYYQTILKDPSFRFATAAQPEPTAVVAGTRFTEREVALINDASKSKGIGKSIPIDADDIEDQNILVWGQRVGNKDQTVLSFKVRPEAEARFVKAIRAGGIAEEQQLRLPQDMTWGFYDDILGGLKTINYHIAKHDTKWNMAKINAALKHKDTLLMMARSREANVANMAAYYLEQITKIEDVVLHGRPPRVAKNFKPFLVSAEKDEAVAVGYTSLVRKEGKVLKREILPTGEIKSTGGLVDPAVGKITQQYEVTFSDGTVLRYNAWDDANSFSVQGQVEIVIDGKVDAQTVDRALKNLEALGLNGKVATAVDQELMYLKKQAYSVRESITHKTYAKLVDDLAARHASPAEQVTELRRYWSNRLKVPDVTKLPEYQPAGEYVGNTGWRVWYRFDISDADLDNNMSGYTLGHKVTGMRNAVDVIDSMVTKSKGLISTSEKVRMGMFQGAGGMSPSADMSSGGGNYIFTRIVSSGRRYERGNLHFKKRLLRRMDAISYNGDHYGRTTGNFVTTNRKTTFNQWKSAAKITDNETIFKNCVSFLDDLDHIECFGDTREQREIIKKFHDLGITHLPDGRRVEDIVR